MNQKSKKAFTLVELIVVITILAILGTIAFMSLQGYSSKARDGRRISDINNIKTSLEIFSISSGYYPEPDNVGTVYYSGETIFTQGIVGETVTTNLGRNLYKKPTDPLFDVEYIYSVTGNKKEYEVMGIFEGDVLVNSSFIQGDGVGVKSTYALNSYKPKVTGNYNELFVRTNSFIIPLPSIVTSEELGYDLKTNGTKVYSMVIDDGDNFPDFGTSNIEVQTGGLLMNLSVTGVIDDNSSDAEKISVINAIQNAYSGTILEGSTIYQNILSKTSNSGKLNLIEDVVLNNNSSQTTQTILSNSCEQEPDYSNATFIQGEPTEIDQAWQNTDSELPCYYECNSGYGGSDCNTIDTSNLGNLFIDGEDTIEDETGNHSLNIVGAYVDTSKSKYGNSSVFFDGVDDYISSPIHDDFNFGSEDFSVDAWTYKTKTEYGGIASVDGNTVEREWMIRYNTDTSIRFGYQNGGSFSKVTNTCSDAMNAWHHVAVTRESGVVRMFFDGFQIGTDYSTNTFIDSVSEPLRIGTAGPPINYRFGGNMDNIRIVKGQALWTEDFNLTDEELFY